MLTDDKPLVAGVINESIRRFRFCHYAVSYRIIPMVYRWFLASVIGSIICDVGGKVLDCSSFFNSKQPMERCQLQFGRIVVSRGVVGKFQHCWCCFEHRSIGLEGGMDGAAMANRGGGGPGSE
ncbi:hypothetical protein M9H77_02392 [Catharanthus roseus]|uniref:Uncharacterized protein n=1 Tax=Catharanthus roseus TaxID=4058 RepID=A0ACC0C8D0_CATRO|nr:hypothetical protein M9H77_02392 [Catharanthus roseus]